MDNHLTKLSKIEILLTNIGHGQNFDKHWTETGQKLDICQKIVQILSNLPFYRSTNKPNSTTTSNTNTETRKKIKQLTRKGNTKEEIIRHSSLSKLIPRNT